MKKYLTFHEANNTMEDYTNNQLAEIISRSLVQLKDGIQNQENIANKFENSVSKLEKENTEIELKILELKTLRLVPDLSHLNSFYKERTESSVEQLNKRIKMPKLSLYVWATSFIMLITSFIVFFYTSYKTEQQSIEAQKQYKENLLKDNVIISSENAKLLKDMDLWFKSDPQSIDKFIRWRNNHK